MSYRDLEIWRLAREMSIEIHRMTLKNLPKFSEWVVCIDRIYYTIYYLIINMVFQGVYNEN